MTKIKIYSPPAAAIDWQAFSDCIICTRWGSAYELWDDLGRTSKSTAYNAWNGKPIGLIPFLRICKKMRVDPTSFLMER
jgi:hypothetical protein